MKRYFPVLLIACAGLVLSIGSFRTVRQLERQHLKAKFERHASDRAKALQKDLDYLMEMVQSIAGLYAASSKVERYEFKEFVGATLEGHEGIKAFGWVPRVGDSERAAYEKAAREEGLSSFQITQRLAQGRMIKEVKRSEYFPVFYLEPLKGNGATLGFDLASDSKRLEAIEQSRDTGKVVATGRIVLVQDEADRFGFLLLAPVYRKGAPHTTVEDRRENLEGFALGVFRIADIVESSLSHLSPGGVDFYLYDETAPAGERLLYFHPSRKREKPVLPSEERVGSELEWQTTLDFGGRRWALWFNPAPYFSKIASTREAWIILVSGLLLTTVAGAFFFNILIHSDKLENEITERERVEGELQKAHFDVQEAKQYLESLIESSSVAIIANDEAGYITLFNPGAEALLGYSEEEIIGRYVAVLYESEEQAKEVMRVMRDRDGKVSGHETVLLSKDGEQIPVTISASMLYDEEGVGVGVVGYNKDLRERKRVEEALKKSYETQSILTSILRGSLDDITLEEQLERDLDYIIGAPFLSLKPQGGVFLVDEDAGELVLKAHRNYPTKLLETCTRVPIGLCFCGRVAASGRAEFADCLDERHAIRFEGIAPHGHFALPIVSKGKTLGVLLTDVEDGHSWDKREEEFLQTVADTLAGIIERKRGEERLRYAHQQIQEAYTALEKAQTSAIMSEKLAALGRLTAGATHEILNPLNIMNLILHMLVQKSEIPQEVVEDLHVAQEQIERIYAITKGMIHFSSQKPPKAVLLDVNVAVRRAISLINHDLKLKNIDLKLELAEELPSILADDDQLQQVMMNLMTNARDATPEAGRIVIRTEAGCFEGRECVVIRVEDSGAGIPIENMDKLFEPFFTTKGEDKGTGLGLSICQGIIAAHGGDIAAENLPGAGAAFTVRLYTAEESTELTARPKMTSPSSLDKVS